MVQIRTHLLTVFNCLLKVEKNKIQNYILYGFNNNYLSYNTMRLIMVKIVIKHSGAMLKNTCDVVNIFETGKQRTSSGCFLRNSGFVLLTF